MGRGKEKAPPHACGNGHCWCAQLPSSFIKQEQSRGSVCCQLATPVVVMMMMMMGLFHLRKVSLVILALLFVAATWASECQISASQAYVRAIVSHSKKDAAAIPLEKDVVRYEGPPGFSLQSARGEEDLRKSVTSGPSSYTVDGSSNERYTSLNATTVEAIYTIKVGLLQGKLPLTTAKVEEYFTFKSASACKIQRIDAIFYVGQE